MEIVSFFNEGPLIGIRHVQSLMMFLLLAVAYAMRVNLSVAIVSMTNTNQTDSSDVPVSFSKYYKQAFQQYLSRCTIGKSKKKIISYLRFSWDISHCKFWQVN